MMEEWFSLGLEQGCQCYPVSTQCCLLGKRVVNEPKGQNALLNSRVGMQISFCLVYKMLFVMIYKNYDSEFLL